MSTAKVFKLECEADTLIVTALRQISELAEEYVADELQAVHQQVEEAKSKNVVFDLAAIRMVNSAVLEILISIRKQAVSKGGRMLLCNVSPINLQTLKIARIDELCTIHPSRETALQAIDS